MKKEEKKTLDSNNDKSFVKSFFGWLVLIEVILFLGLLIAFIWKWNEFVVNLLISDLIAFVGTLVIYWLFFDKSNYFDEL